MRMRSGKAVYTEVAIPRAVPMPSTPDSDPRWRGLDRNRLNFCIQCGRCTSACPLAVQIEYSPRHKLNEERILEGGNLDETQRSVWTCLSCYSCHEACEQGVHTASVIRTIRQRLFELGEAPEGVKKVAQVFARTGMAFPVTGFTKKMRKDMDLGEVPTVAADPGALEEVRTLLRRAGYPGVDEGEGGDA